MQSPRKQWKVLSGGVTPQRVFEEAFVPHVDRLYSLALRLTSNSEAAADLLQDTALKAFERFHQLRRTEASRAWLVKIMTTTFLDRYAPKIREQQPAADEEPISYETPEVEMLRRSDAKAVEAALLELREEYRLTVLLADVHEISLREIAAMCKCPIGTVASRLARGREQLRKRLAHSRGARENDTR